MVQGIGGDGGVDPALLKKEYQQAAKGFQEALDKFNQPLMDVQKQQCKQVMHEYMNIMNHIASDLKQARASNVPDSEKDAILKQTSKLAADLKVFDQDDSAANQIKADLNEIQSDD